MEADTMRAGEETGPDVSIQLDDFCLQVALVLRRILNLEQKQRDDGEIDGLDRAGSAG